MNGENMTSTEIRDSFLKFFERKGHRIVPSSPVVPYDDPTLLFTNAGMNQFKDVFLGTGKRDYTRAVDSQKCIRVSGKHNDLEVVGHDAYHHTFFEMLGNWSFGDYYKKEAIQWAWELLTEVWCLPKKRLWATVFETDDESAELWQTVTGIAPGNVVRFGAKDNFWEMGDTGPCGPCSEIHIDMTKDGDAGRSMVNAGTAHFTEIWNLVFIQYNRNEKGELEELPSKHVDTGMGFERVCAILQGKKSNYQSDVFMPVINAISELAGKKYDSQYNQIAMRVIADHLRALTFAVADGAIPSNEGRGYVLRRILRRALRYCRNLEVHEPFVYKLVPTLVKTMGSAYPEISEKQKFIERVIQGEEESFNTTLDRGIEIFEEVVKGVLSHRSQVIPGEDAFKLYDTFGFPIDLTALLAQEKGLTIDMAVFGELMQGQRERARSSARFNVVADKIVATESQVLREDLRTVFSYDMEERVLERVDDLDLLSFELAGATKTVGFAFNGETPFYAESGGQVGDTGEIVFENDRLEIADTKWVLDQYIVNFPKDPLDAEGKFRRIKEFLGGGGVAMARIDSVRRKAIMRNHSATHLLHAALRKILGTHVHQSGSLVEPSRLRFDFTHYSKVTEDELRDIERLVSDKIRESLPLTHHRDIPFDEARKMGALAFFGDKYGDKVNVVQFGDFTMEFCGGTHVKNTTEIGLIKITSESSIASGIRRIEAVTGEGVEKIITSQLEKINELSGEISRLLEEKKSLEKELSKYKLEAASASIAEMVEQAGVLTPEGIKIVAARIDAPSLDHLKSLGDSLRSKLGTGVGVLGTVIEGEVALVCVVTEDLIKSKKILAGKIVGDLSKIVGGGGGGRPHLATGGGKDIKELDRALKSVQKIIGQMLS
jgi:alanyl-tRNA synthetase